MVFALVEDKKLMIISQLRISNVIGILHSVDIFLDIQGCYRAIRVQYNFPLYTPFKPFWCGRLSRLVIFCDINT